MLARVAITSRMKELSNVDDRARRGSVANIMLEENGMNSENYLLVLLGVLKQPTVDAYTMISFLFSILIQTELFLGGKFSLPQSVSLTTVAQHDVPPLRD